jgi:hypothetical protein
MTAQFTVPDTGPAASEQFRSQGHVVIPQLIDPSLVSFLWSYVHTKFAGLLLNPGDAQVPNTPAGYGDPTFDGLLEYLRPQIEQRLAIRLHPTYSYFRLYKHGDVLHRHRDRRACEISVSLNLGQVPGEPWPIYVDSDARPSTALLWPGDALLYRGCDFAHWRDAYPGDRLAQAFLHYVDRDGANADQKFDRRQALMLPAKHKRGDQGQAVDFESNAAASVHPKTP